MMSVLAVAIAATDAVVFIAREPAAPQQDARHRLTVAMACTNRIGAIILAYSAGI